jgi:hypothetical protein
MNSTLFNIRKYKFCKHGTDSITKVSISPIFNAVNHFFYFFLKLYETSTDEPN